MEALLSSSRVPTLGSVGAAGAPLSTSAICTTGVHFASRRQLWRLNTREAGYRQQRREQEQGAVHVKAIEPNTVSSDTEMPTTATDAVELGLSLFSKGRVTDALSQFDAALEMRPNFEEAQAALYNKACCHARKGEGAKASQALRRALRQYDLKFSVILNDQDMAPFRAMPEFKELQDEARKGGKEVGESFRRDLKLISEVQAPFRSVRKFFYAALVAAAGLSTVITVPRLVLALQGGEGAPSLFESSQNLAINIGGAGILIALYIWENRKEEEQITKITRNETLSRLPLRLSTGRIVELVQLRENTRPVIVAGSAERVEKSMKMADRYREDLLKRGVLVIPLVWSGQQGEPPKKKGFGSLQKPAMGWEAWVEALQDEFEQRALAVASKGVTQSGKRFKAEVVSPGEWERWIKEQQVSEGVTAGEDVYVVLRLDGRVRKSGRGIPDWIEIVNELAPLDTFISNLEK